MEEITKLPPVTKFICASTALVTFPVIMRWIDPIYLVFVKRLVLENHQLWRVPTSVFYAGHGFPLVARFLALLQLSITLENGLFRSRSYDYGWQLLWATVVTSLMAFVTNTPLILPCIVLSLATFSALVVAGSNVSLLGLFSFPTEYLPYCYALMELGISTDRRKSTITLAGAVVVGYLWSCFDNPRLPSSKAARAPKFVQKLVGAGDSGGKPPSNGSTRQFGARTAGLQDSKKKITFIKRDAVSSLRPGGGACSGGSCGMT